MQWINAAEQNSTTMIRQQLLLKSSFLQLTVVQLHLARVTAPGAASSITEAMFRVANATGVLVGLVTVPLSECRRISVEPVCRYTGLCITASCVFLVQPEPVVLVSIPSTDNRVLTILTRLKRVGIIGWAELIG